MPLIIIITICRLLLLSDKFFFINYNSEIKYNNKLNLLNENFLSLSKFYNYPNNFITILLIIYLLLTLIVVVKVTNSFIGPLRQKN